MTSDDLLSYLFRGSKHEPPRCLRELLQDCAMFSEFVALNRNKIRKKIRCAGKEDLGDVLAELRVAYLLLSDDRIDIEYEKYGSKIRAPDLTATFMMSVRLNVEVARIRRVEVDIRYETWYRNLRGRIGAGGAGVDWHVRLDESEMSLSRIAEFEQSTEETVRFIRSTIQEEGTRLPHGTTKEYPIRRFENKLVLILSRDYLDSEEDKDLYVRCRPIACTQREHLKCGDIVLDKLDQLHPGMINVIFIISDSDNHWPNDLEMGMSSLCGALGRRDKEIMAKVTGKFGSVEDFETQFARLSAIVLRCNETGHGEPNILWLNPSADNSMPELLSQCLRQIDHPLA